MGNKSGSIRYQVAASLAVNREKLQMFERMRSNVYRIGTDKGKYVLKGFSSKNKLEAQRSLTKKLRKNGFRQTYRFLSSLPDIPYGKMTYAWIEYLEPSSEKFSYYTKKNRYYGMELLQQFHETTRKFYNDIPASSFDQVYKWQERLYTFKKNIGIVKGYVSMKNINQWIEWGEKSLKGLGEYEEYLNREPTCIIHGDVAHHNFFAAKNGQLNIIDFDLIHRATPIIDYIQFANRIMPFVKDSSELFSYPQLKRYRNNPAFLYAMLYPADIFREWNRLIRENLYNNNEYMHSIWKITVEQFQQRMALYKEIYKRINR
ncbi:phosphotransferase [Bacillus sp. 1P06AnD]|uniref:phosphotransferase n=1 Tax=Bacillus sp. 1P06AnD TaxID=3132208 RepID=UPI0039A180F0